METIKQNSSDKTKVGIPRALHYFKFFPFWKKLFDELDVEIVLTPPTNKKIVEEGVTHGFGELCLPVKVYNGHAKKEGLASYNPDLLVDSLEELLDLIGIKNGRISDSNVQTTLKIKS